MQRRNLLIGMGSIAAGGAATIGTGAMSSLSSERSMTVPIAADKNALIGISAANSSNGDDFAENDSGEISLDFTTTGAEGFSKGVTWVDNLLELTNNASSKQYLWMVKDGNSGGDKAVGFYVGTGPSDGSDPDYQVSVGSNQLKPRDLQPLKPYDNTVVPDEGTHAVPLSTGGSEKIGMVVDTRQLKDTRSPGALLNSVTIHSVSDTTDLPEDDPRSLDPTLE